MIDGLVGVWLTMLGGWQIMLKLEPRILDPTRLGGNNGDVRLWRFKERI